MTFHALNFFLLCSKQMKLKENYNSRSVWCAHSTSIINFRKPKKKNTRKNFRNFNQTMNATRCCCHSHTAPHTNTTYNP